MFRIITFTIFLVLTISALGWTEANDAADKLKSTQGTSSDYKESSSILGFIDIHGSVELGYLLRATDQIEDYSSHVRSSHNFFDYGFNPYFDLGFYLTFFKALNVGGSIRSIFKYDNSVTCIPLLDKYSVFIELFLFDHVHAGFSHCCEHSSVPYYIFYGMEAAKTIDRSEEKLYVRFSF